MNGRGPWVRARTGGGECMHAVRAAGCPLHGRWHASVPGDGAVTLRHARPGGKREPDREGCAAIGAGAGRVGPAARQTDIWAGRFGRDPKDEPLRMECAVARRVELKCP